MRTAGTRGLVMVSLLLALPTFTQAQSPAIVPVGTKVALRFLTGLDSTTAVQDQRIDFRVAAPVTVNRRIVLREGARRLMDSLSQSFGRPGQGSTDESASRLWRPRL